MYRRGRYRSGPDFDAIMMLIIVVFTVVMVTLFATGTIR